MDVINKNNALSTTLQPQNTKVAHAGAWGSRFATVTKGANKRQYDCERSEQNSASSVHENF